MKMLINKKEHIICLISVVVLLALTGVFLFKDRELSDIFALLAGTDLRFIFLGLLAMVLFFAFEARAIQILLQPLAGKRKYPVFYRYALIDFTLALSPQDAVVDNHPSCILCIVIISRSALHHWRF